MKECFAQPYYRWVIASIVVSALVFLPVNLYSLPYAKNLHISMAQYGRYVALSYKVSLCLSYFLGYFADRLHPLRVGIASMAIYAAVMLWGGVYAIDPSMYAVVFVAHTVLSGAFFTCTASLGQRLFPKLRYAQYASAAGMVLAIANIVISPIIGRFLDATHHTYRYTYDIGCGLAIIAVLITYGVWLKFKDLGGTSSYVPPE
jgi:MFS family permease